MLKKQVRRLRTDYVIPVRRNSLTSHISGHPTAQSSVIEDTIQEESSTDNSEFFKNFEKHENTSSTPSDLQQLETSQNWDQNSNEKKNALKLRKVKSRSLSVGSIQKSFTKETSNQSQSGQSTNSNGVSFPL